MVLEPRGFIIVPHSSTGDPLDESEMKVTFTKSYKYLREFHGDLMTRSIHKLWGKGKPFYSIYDIGAYTFKPFKVVYQDISGKISAKGEFGGAAVVTHTHSKYLNEKLVIPDHTLMFVPCETVDESYYLTSILNSVIVRFVAVSLLCPACWRTHNQLRGYQTVLILKTHCTKGLYELSRRAHELARKWREQDVLDAKTELEKVEAENNLAVAQVYGISQDEMRDITAALAMLKPDES